MSGDYTISGVVPLMVASSASAAGLDGDALLARSGIALAMPPRAEEHVSAERYFELWRRAVAQLDPGFPLRVAATVQLEDQELFGFLAMSCETLGRAYERTAAYRALYCVGARWELIQHSDSTRLIWYPWPGDRDDPGFRAAMDFAVADMANAIRRLGRDAPRPTTVRLEHRCASPAAFHEHYGVEPQFGAPLYELVYGPGVTDQPIATFNSRLRDYFEEECRRLLATLDRDKSTHAQVRTALIAAMDGGDTAIEAVAKRLATSSRSLQRRLADEGTRFNDVLADVRAEFAKRYLSRGSLSASEVAYLIGFTEPPAFFKAFKRWTGMTPGEFQLGGR